MEYTLLCMYEHHKKYKNLGGGGGGSAKCILQHMSIVHYSYNFIQTVLEFKQDHLKWVISLQP